MNQHTTKKLPGLLALFSFGLSALFILLARIYTVSCSDIIFMDTALPEILEILINILECAVYGISYAFLLYAAFRFYTECFSKAILIYTGSVAFKYIGNYAVTWITDTGMSAEYLLENLSYILLYIAIELAQAGLVVLITWRTMKSYHAFIERQQHIAANLPDANVTIRTYVFPFTKLISLQNPLQKCAFWGGTAVSLFKIVSRLIFDFSYGLPTSLVDGLWMVIYYLMDMFAGFAVCLLITYLIMTFDSRELKAVEQ